jgi:hypothetical protein
MKDQAKINLKGEITILQGKEVIFRERNTITSDATEILLNCMASPSSGLAVDFIKVILEDASYAEKMIAERIVDLVDNTVTYVATLFEGDLVGTITELNLNMGTLNKSLAIKTGLSVVKPDIVAYEIRWKIQINIL